MNHSPVKMPVRISSLLAPTREIRSIELENNLKWKAPEMSLLSQSSIGSIDSQLAYQSATFESTEIRKALKESFYSDIITAQQLRDHAKELFRKREKAAISMANLTLNRQQLAEKLNDKQEE